MDELLTSGRCPVGFLIGLPGMIPLNKPERAASTEMWWVLLKEVGHGAMNNDEWVSLFFAAYTTFIVNEDNHNAWPSDVMFTIINDRGAWRSSCRSFMPPHPTRTTRAVRGARQIQHFRRRIDAVGLGLPLLRRKTSPETKPARRAQNFLAGSRRRQLPCKKLTADHPLYPA
jgi:hypothetical protein